jgi:tetratricopeptide (TPR) repeat protein
MRFVLLLIYITLSFNLHGQTFYEVDIDDRNLAIELNKEAEKFLNENRVKTALDRLLESISVDSLLRESYLLIYQLWLAEKSYTETIATVIYKGKQIFNDDDELCFYYAELLRFQSMLPEAILEYTNAMNYARRNGEDFYLVHYYYLNRGNCFLSMNMEDGALADFNYALKLKPDFTAALCGRGVCLFRKGNKDKACTDWQQALKLGYAPVKQYIDKYCK